MKFSYFTYNALLRTRVAQNAFRIFVWREISKNKCYRVRFALAKPKPKRSFCCGWGGRIRTYAMLESESNALPLGDTPLTRCIGRFSHREQFSGVIEENRTLDLQSHNLAFCQLNYDHHKKGSGAPGRIRTFDLCLRRALLYPAELRKPMERVKGIGPSRPAWKAGVLPLNYTRTYYVDYGSLS